MKGLMSALAKGAVRSFNDWADVVARNVDDVQKVIYTAWIGKNFDDGKKLYLEVRGYVKGERRLTSDDVWEYVRHERLNAISKGVRYKRYSEETFKDNYDKGAKVLKEYSGGLDFIHSGAFMNPPE